MDDDCLPYLDDSRWIRQSSKFKFVNVDNIIGSANLGYMKYDSDWTPKESDNRHSRIRKGIKEGKSIDEMGGTASYIGLYRTPDGQIGSVMTGIIEFL